MKINNMIWMRIVTSIIIVTLLCPNSALAGQEDCLAAQSRLSPFFSKHGLGVNNIGKVTMAAARLKKVLFGEIKADINNEIQDLNGFLSDISIEIEKDIREYKFQCSGRKVQYAVFNFKEVETKINAFFIKGHRELTKSELEEIGISDKEIHHLECLGLEGVWLTKVISRTREPNNKRNKISRDYALCQRDLEQSLRDHFTQIGEPTIKDHSAAISYCHNGTGLIVIEKKSIYGPINRRSLQKLIQADLPNCCPILLQPYNNQTYFEVDMRPYGYVLLNDFVKDMNPNDPRMTILAKIVFANLFLLAEKRLSHGHPHFKNILVHPTTGEFIFIDFKELTEMESVIDAIAQDVVEFWHFFITRTFREDQNVQQAGETILKELFALLSDDDPTSLIERFKNVEKEYPDFSSSRALIVALFPEAKYTDFMDMKKNVRRGFSLARYQIEDKFKTLFTDDIKNQIYAVIKRKVGGLGDESQNLKSLLGIESDSSSGDGAVGEIEKLDNVKSVESLPSKKEPSPALLSLPIGDVGRRFDLTGLSMVEIADCNEWTLLQKLGSQSRNIIQIIQEQEITIHMFSKAGAGENAPLLFRINYDLYVREDLEEFLDGTEEGRLFVLAELYHDLLGHDPRVSGDIHDTAEEFFAFMAGELRVLLGFIFPEELTVESLKSALENVLTDENIDRLAGIREMVVRKIRNSGDTEVDNILNALQRLKGKTGNRAKKLIEMIAESYGFRLEDSEIEGIISTTIKCQSALNLLEQQKSVVERFIIEIKNDNIKDRNIILAWDNDLGIGKDYEKLLTELELKDLGNIHFVRARGSELQGAIDNKKKELRGDTEVVLIAKKKNMDSLTGVERLYTVALDDQNIQEGNYLPILEILTFGLTIAYDKDNRYEISRLYEDITGIKLLEGQYRRFIKEGSIELILPPVVPIDINRLGEIYKLSAELLIAA